MKRCTRCKTRKPFDEFQNSARSRDGRQPWCKDCHRDYSQEWRDRPGVRESRQAAARGRYTARQRKDAGLRALYGITIEDFESRMEAQGGRCLVCSSELDGGKHTHVDHCHDAKIVRGLLCSLCNKGIGCLRDDPALLRAAAAYLEDAHA